MSKLNIDQKTVKGLFHHFLEHINKLVVFHSPTMTLISSTTMTNISLVQLSHLKIMTKRWRSLMGSNV